MREKVWFVNRKRLNILLDWSWREAVLRWVKRVVKGSSNEKWAVLTVVFIHLMVCKTACNHLQQPPKFQFSKEKSWNIFMEAFVLVYLKKIAYSLVYIHIKSKMRSFISFKSFLKMKNLFLQCFARSPSCIFRQRQVISLP